MTKINQGIEAIVSLLGSGAKTLCVEFFVFYSCAFEGSRKQQKLFVVNFLNRGLSVLFIQTIGK